MFNISGFPSSSSLVLSAKLPTGRNIGCIRRAGKKFLAAREYYKNCAELFQKQLKREAKVSVFSFSILFIHEGYRELRYITSCRPRCWVLVKKNAKFINEPPNSKAEISPSCRILSQLAGKSCEEMAILLRLGGGGILGKGPFPHPPPPTLLSN